MYRCVWSSFPSNVLYHEIVSHARVVSACIRAASEKEKQQQQLQQQQQQQHLLTINDSSLIAEQTNSSLSSTDDTTTTITTTTTATTTSTPTTGTTNSDSSGIVVDATLDAEKSLTFAETASPSTNSSSEAIVVHHNKKIENQLERLQNRYHLLYLKAFEVQLWLDGLLRKKSISANQLQTHYRYKYNSVKSN
ncbi:hypothetical protein GQX74_002943 [Glossina fuscipes]|nr:hypothetical protein GQX74_002943 [Glossina fuscipes]